MIKSKNIVKKICFVLLLLGVGFSFEYFLYKNKLDYGSTTLIQKETKILIVGGSISRILPAAFTSVTKRLQLNNFNFSGAWQPALSSSMVLTLLEDYFLKHSPNIVFLQIGLHESSQDLGMILPQNETAVRRLSELAANSDANGLNKLLLDNIERFSRLEGEKNLLSHLYFITDKKIISLLSRDKLMKGMIKSLDHELQKKRPDVDKFLDIVLLANRIFPVIQRGEDKMLPLLIRNFSQLLTEGGKFIRKNGCSKIPVAGYVSYFSEADWRWLCLVDKLAGKKTIVEQLEDSPDLISPFITKWPNLQTSLSLSTGQEHSRLLGILTKYKNSKSINFFNNIRLIRDRLDKSNVELVLLNYPNLDLPIIRLAGKRFNLRTLDGQSVFSGMVTAQKRHLYFLDNIHGGGHMTTLASEMYAKSIINQMPDVFKK